MCFFHKEMKRHFGAKAKTDKRRKNAKQETRHFSEQGIRTWHKNKCMLACFKADGAEIESFTFPCNSHSGKEEHGERQAIGLGKETKNAKYKHQLAT